MTEKRNFTRVEFDAIATIETKGKTWDTKIIDISLKGALIQKPQNVQLATGDNVELKLTLSDNNTEIEVNGQITHIEKEHVGILCEHMDIDSASHLRRIVELNTGNSELLERELEALCQFTDLDSFHT